MNFKERETREIVWGYKVKFKNETDDQHTLSKAPKYMPYIIIGTDNDEYYAMLITTNPIVERKHFFISKNKYPELKKNLYIKLDEIYKLKRTDIVKNYIGDDKETLKINEKDYKTLLDYIKSTNLLDEEDKLIFDKLYNDINPLDVRDMVCIKEDEEFKEYTIFSQINEDEFYGVKTNIPYRMTKTYKNMNFDFSDIRIFSKKNIIPNKYSKVLYQDEVEKINDRANFYRLDIFQSKYNKKFEFGTIININDSEYIVLEDEDNSIYLTKRRDFYEVLTISKLDKEKISIEEIGMLDIKTRIKLLKRLEWDIKEIWTPKLQKEVVEKIKLHKKQRDIL